MYCRFCSASDMMSNRTWPGAPHLLIRRVPPPKPLILCVEDDAGALELRKAVLQQNGYSVISATRAQDALQALQEAPVCLVLSDHILGGARGADLAIRMKAIKPDVPVVLYSGHPPDSMGGVDCFINKSEPRNQFLAIISDLIRRYCDAV
jgi:CheY-like chemotaxis protein